jgi:hypothetical protein
MEHEQNIEVEVQEQEQDLQQEEDVAEKIPSSHRTSDAVGILKPKKPRSQKQLEAFEKCRLARQKKIQERKTPVKNTASTPPKIPTKKKSRKVVYLPQQNVESSDEEEEIVYIPKQKSKKNHLTSLFTRHCIIHNNTIIIVIPKANFLVSYTISNPSP